MFIILLIKEFIQDIRFQKTRAFLTTVAITWGVFAIILLMAFGEGLGVQMREGLLNAGDRIIRVYGGQTTKKYNGMPFGRRIRLVETDAEILKHIPQVSTAVPGYGQWGRPRIG